MATVLTTDLSTLLILIRNRIMTKLDFPAERVLILARDEPPFDPQADQYIIIRPQEQRPDMLTEYGHGRIEHRVRRKVRIKLRTRLATDEATSDLLWLTDKSLGHLAMEHTLYDAMQTFLPVDMNQNALVYEPLIVTGVPEPEKDPVNTEWGESAIDVELPFIMNLDQTYDGTPSLPQNILLVDDSFQRLDTTAGNPGNGWIDGTGNWRISGGFLTPTTGDISNIPSFPCLRPTSETPINQLIVGNVADAGAEPTFHKVTRLVLRHNGLIGNTAICYECTVSWTSNLVNVHAVVNGTATTIASTGYTPVLSGVPYTVTFSCIGTNPTQLRMTIRKTIAPDTILLDMNSSNFAAMADSTSVLQSTGQIGVDAWDAKQYTRVRTYNFNGTIPSLV